MKTLKIIVKGYVQKVGYREEVERIARELAIVGYAKNLDDPELSVEIIAQHNDERILKEFVEKIKIRQYPVEVRQVKAETVVVKEIYPIFTVIHGPFDKEFGERMVEAKRSLDRIENKLDQFNNSTQQQFQHLDVKYGKVSEKLEKISNSLEIVAVYLPKLLDRIENKK